MEAFARRQESALRLSLQLCFDVTLIDLKSGNCMLSAHTLCCPICQSTASHWVDLPSAELFRCNECRHCFTDPSSIKQEESYGSDYYVKTHRNWFENPNYPLFSLLTAQILGSGAKSVLDVGCGNGAFLKYLAERAPDAVLYGIDLSSAGQSGEKVCICQGDFLNFDFQRKFDSVVTLAVIEHLTDVGSFVKRIHETLNENGTAYVMTLNEQGILYMTANFLRKIGLPSVFNRLYDPHHLNHFSKNSLQRLLTQGGLFKLIDVIDHDTPLASIDIPANNPVSRWVLKTGVAAIFFLGKLTGRTYLQTLKVAKVG